MSIEKIYAPWLHSRRAEYAQLQMDTPEALYPVIARLVLGHPVSDAFPEDAVCGLDPESGVFLPDSIANTDGIYIVSERLRDVLACTGARFEFHRIRIRNHKKRIEREPYFIANLLDVVDCMDRERSDYVVSGIDPSQVDRIRSLVLDVSKIPDEAQIFRLGSDRSLFMVRKDLAYEIYRVQKLEGMLFKKIELYGEEFRARPPEERGS